MDLLAISSAVQTICELLTQEVTSLLGIEDQVEDLKIELIWMRSFLREVEARKAHNEVVRTSVAAIRELAYDAEDIIDTFALKVASKRKNCIGRSACILKEAILLRRTKSELERIAARITKLTRRLQTYDVKMSRDEGGSSSSKERIESRRPYPHIIEDNIVGLDDDMKTLVSVLVDKKNNGGVVSICGMGGLGKTTLAKKVYRHSQVVGHFSHLAWVYVSQQFQIRKVWEDILSGFNKLDKEDRKKRDEVVAEKLSNILEKNKCLVILDDIWRTQDWDSLKPAFPARNSSSKILLTSRNKEVVSHADRRGYLHELQCLTEEQSWELFQKIASPESDSPDSKVDGRMKDLGKSMVKHCAGLPLATIVLGGILATKNSLIEWQMVSENVGSFLKKGKGQSTMDVLALSYDDLPPYLKPCFLYLSHFPEDYEINAQRLIQLWVAEGIVSSNQGEENEGEIMEHVAERYLIELGERFMIQVLERDASFRIKKFQMHDLMRDLCLKKAKQEKFLFIMDESVTQNHNALSSTIRGVRRVAAHQFLGIQRIKSPQLRSLLIFDDFFPEELHVSRSVPLTILVNYIENHENDCNRLICIAEFLSMCIMLTKMVRIWTYMFNNFKLLRVLGYEGGGEKAGCKVPSEIGNLIHLRFLSLNGLEFRISKLPSSLGNLSCLQTLDLRVENPFVHVPNVIWMMEQLRHLYLPDECNPKTKLKLGTLTYLQTLVNFSPMSCYMEDLLNMKNLSELKIVSFFLIQDFKENLEMNQPILSSEYLRSLSIDMVAYVRGRDRQLAHLLSSCVNICELSLRGMIEKLPEYHNFSSSIAYIRLSQSYLQEDPMLTLEKLPNLRVLELHDEAFRGNKIACSAQGFSKLDSLSLKWLDNLEEWKVDEGAMPALWYLEICYCKNLKTLPDELKFITTLKELKIEGMPKTFKDKLVEGGEDFCKVQRVPSFISRNCD